MIEQPWGDERLKINGRFVGCVTKANADEVIALQRDAARYRCLKEHILGPRPELCVTVNIGHEWSRVSEIDELDEVIDAAMMPNAKVRGPL